MSERCWRTAGWRGWCVLLAGLASAAVAGVAAADDAFTVRSLVDVVGHGNRSAVYLNKMMYQANNFDNLRARIFLEGGRERTHAFLQFLVSDVGSSNFRFYGGYLQHQLVEGREMYLEVGKIPVHEGTWAPRTYSDKNPLLGVPLAYYYKSTLPFRQVPRDLDQLVAQRGRGQSGVNYTNLDGTPRGTTWASLPILYDNCWDYGAFLLGAGARYDYAFGVSMGSTGAPVPGTDTNGSLGLHAKFGFAPVPALKLHASFARGAYLFDEVQAFLPANARARDFAQTVIGGSVEWGWRHLTVNSEVFHNQFETPLRAGGLGSVAGYFESVYTFLPGWYVAGRFDTMRFAAVTTSTGTQTWDENIQRLEGGVGFHASRDLLLKAVAQVYERGDDWEWNSLLPALQLSFRY